MARWLGLSGLCQRSESNFIEAALAKKNVLERGGSAGLGVLKETSRRGRSSHQVPRPQRLLGQRQRQSRGSLRGVVMGPTGCGLKTGCAQ